MTIDLSTLNEIRNCKKVYTFKGNLKLPDNVSVDVFLEQIKQALEKNGSLTSIIFDSVEEKLIYNLLQQLPPISSLGIRNPTRVALEILARYLQSHHNIVRFLCDERVEPLIFLPFFEAIKNNTQVKVILLLFSSNPQIYKDTNTCFSLDELHNSGNEQIHTVELWIGENYIPVSYVGKLIDKLSNYKNIKQLYLYFANKVHSINFTPILNALCKNTYLNNITINGTITTQQVRDLNYFLNVKPLENKIEVKSGNIILDNANSEQTTPGKLFQALISNSRRPREFLSSSENPAKKSRNHQTSSNTTNLSNDPNNNNNNAQETDSAQSFEHSLRTNPEPTLTHQQPGMFFTNQFTSNPNAASIEFQDFARLEYQCQDNARKIEQLEKEVRNLKENMQANNQLLDSVANTLSLADLLSQFLPKTISNPDGIRAPIQNMQEENRSSNSDNKTSLTRQ